MTDIAVRPDHTDITLPTDPTGRRLVSWAEAGQAANQLARALSTTNFVPKGMQDIGNATAAILMGDELGLSPIASLRAIYVVHGTPALYARTMVALALSHGHEIWTESSSDQAVTVCGKRRGSEHVERAEWSIQRATKAGYTSNAKYKTNPVEMLYAKAAAEIARRIAADVLAGVPYSVEDLELEQPATTTVTREPTRRVQRSKPQPPEPEIPDTEPPTQDVSDAVEMVTPAQLKKIATTMGILKIVDRDAVLSYVRAIVGRDDIESRSELSKAEAHTLIEAIEQDIETDKVSAGGAS